MTHKVSGVSLYFTRHVLLYHLPKDHQPRLLGLEGSSIVAVTFAAGFGSGIGSGSGITAAFGSVIGVTDTGSGAATGVSAATFGPVSSGSASGATAAVVFTLAVRFRGARGLGAGFAGASSSKGSATSAALVSTLTSFFDTFGAAFDVDLAAGFERLRVRVGVFLGGTTCSSALVVTGSVVASNSGPSDALVQMLGVRCWRVRCLGLCVGARINSL